MLSHFDHRTGKTYTAGDAEPTLAELAAELQAATMQDLREQLNAANALIRENVSAFYVVVPIEPANPRCVQAALDRAVLLLFDKAGKTCGYWQEEIAKRRKAM